MGGYRFDAELDTGLEMTQEQMAVEGLKALAHILANDSKAKIIFTQDWGFGTATINDETGNHVHIGFDDKDENVALFNFIHGFYTHMTNSV